MNIVMFELQKLSLLNRICKELNTHVGILDKDLSSFVIHLVEKSDSFEMFQRCLKENNASFDGLFAKKLYNLVQRMGIKHVDDQFPALSICDNVRGGQLEVEMDIVSTKGVEEDLKKVRSPIRSRSRGRYQRSRSRSNDRRRYRSYSRDRRYTSSRYHSPARRHRSHSRERSREYSRSIKRSRLRSSISPERVNQRHKPLKQREHLNINEIYRGKVVKIVKYGCFVHLDEFIKEVSGLVHISELSEDRVSSVQDVVRPYERVFVRLLDIDGDRLRLSLKGIDQRSGEEVSSSKSVIQDKSVKRRLTSPERWELSRLAYSNVLPTSVLISDDEEDEEDRVDIDIDIELNNEEPVFLRGQTFRSIAHSPIRVVKNPDGSLQHSATLAPDFAKERRLLRRKLEEEEIKDRDSNSYYRNQVSASKDVEYGRKESSLSLKEQRKSLPIYKLRKDLMNAIKDHKILVVIGETGSGKSTQLTQYLHEDGYTKRGMIACTQPRRVAATSVAKRVSEEYGCRLGDRVGYSIRFDDCTSSRTILKYCTDGMLLRECLLDPDLNKYSVVILDEAHERTIYTDVLFGLLKGTISRRKDLRLIVTSATLDASKFAEYFNDCPIFTIPGRLYPVTTLYSKESTEDYIEGALHTAMELHLTEAPGDILIFLTGKEEIDTSCQILIERMKRLGKKAMPLIVLPVYSSLPSELQSKIFEATPKGSRKCVIATNIAEASLTIDGINYVIDPGFVKQKIYDPKLGMDSLVVTPISQASANQRTGRAGRVGPGKCFRLYTEDAFNLEMLPCTVPEIQRTNLANTVLLLKALGINNILKFPFMDRPPVQTMISAMELLYDLGALDEDGLLTLVGRKMAEFPLDPSMSKMLISSEEFKCTDEMLTIVAMLSVSENIFFRPRDKQEAADRKRGQFLMSGGDHLSLLQVYKTWVKYHRSSGWSKENFIQHRSLVRAEEVRNQLILIMNRFKISIISCKGNYTNVRKAICSGYFHNAAKKDPQDGYRTLVEDTPVYIHPSSALFYRKPQYCVYHNLVLTSKEYMREVTMIDPKWLVELAPRFFKVSDSSKLSKRKRTEKIKPLFDRRDADGTWRLSQRKE